MAGEGATGASGLENFGGNFNRDTRIQQEMERVRKSDSKERQTNGISSIPDEAKRQSNVVNSILDEAKRQNNGINSIPVDVLVSLIFVRLPARSVLVVRLVCKSWYSLTKSSRFILSHAHRARKNIVFFKSNVKYTLCHVSLNESTERSARRRVVDVERLHLPRKLIVEDYIGINTKLRLVASCDGLLCLEFEGQNNMRRIGYVVCNPVTEDWLNVPRKLHNGCRGFIIAFYFHSSTGEYRLLQQYHEDHTKNRELYETSDPEDRDYIGYEVFSIGGSNRSAWRTINAPSGISSLPWTSLLRRSHISIHESIPFLSPKCDCILAFNTNTEKFRKMSIPPLLHPQACDNNLIEMGGSLGLWQISEDSNEMDIWCLKDYTKEEWVKHYTVSLMEISNSKLCTSLAVWEDGKELLLRFGHGGSFVLYNLESKTFETTEISKLTDMWVSRIENRKWDWVPHIESLVSCNSLKKPCNL